MFCACKNRRFILCNINVCVWICTGKNRTVTNRCFIFYFYLYCFFFISVTEYGFNNVARWKNCGTNLPTNLFLCVHYNNKNPLQYELSMYLLVTFTFYIESPISRHSKTIPFRRVVSALFNSGHVR